MLVLIVCYIGNTILLNLKGFQHDEIRILDIPLHLSKRSNLLGKQVTSPAKYRPQHTED